jgi:hypothetical protein
MLRAALMGVCLLACLPAWAIYKCEVDGKIAYSEAPCQGGKETRIAAPEPEPADVRSAHKQAVRQKQEADRLTQARHDREARDAKLQKRSAGDAAAHEKKCRKLALHKARTANDTTGRTRLDIEAVNQRAKQAAQKYEAECGQ